MANPEHHERLRQGVDAWNAWREKEPSVRPWLAGEHLTGANLNGANLRGVMLRGATLSGAKLAGADFTEAQLYEAHLKGTNLRRVNFTRANLSGATLRKSDLSGAILRGAKLSGAHLTGANFTGADLSGATLSGAQLNEANFNGANLSGVNLSSANLKGATLYKADLSGANLRDADLSEANLSGADLSRANLSVARISRTNLSGAKLAEANLNQATLVETDLTDANLTGCHVYGISAWRLKLKNTKQDSLRITQDEEPAVLVDDIEVAQFIHLLMDREKIRNVIDAVTRRGVLILGRFGDRGLSLLQAVAAWLRMRENGGYLPLLFDFPRPESKTYTETIRTLAGLARFVIVDLSGPSVPQEITATVDLYEIPFVPILEGKREDWSMFRDFLTKERVLKPIRFYSEDHLLGILGDSVVGPAEKLIAQRQRRLDEIFGRGPPSGAP